MSGRPAMPPGTWGTVLVSRTTSGTYQAETRYRSFSGRISKQRARGRSASAARSELVQRLTGLNEQSGVDGELTRNSTVAELAETWLAEKQLEGIAPNTLRGYHGVVINHVVPAIGARPIGSCRTSVLDRVIKSHVEQGAMSPRSATPSIRCSRSRSATMHFGRIRSPRSASSGAPGRRSLT